MKIYGKKCIIFYLRGGGVCVRLCFCYNKVGKIIKVFE